MRYHTLVIPETSLHIGDTVALSEAHQHHLQAVLRKTAGDHVILASPAGYFIAKLVTSTPTKLAAEILTQQARTTQSPIAIHLYQGICQPKKMDLITQKTTELGITAITPIATERSQYPLERYMKKLDRLRTIAENACEQSQRNIIPTINTGCHLADISAPSSACNLVLVPDATDTLASITQPPTQCNILIGPEGGLSAAEISHLITQQWQPIRFGPRILRTETAAIAITTAIATLWGDCK